MIWSEGSVEGGGVNPIQIRTNCKNNILGRPLILFCWFLWACSKPTRHLSPCHSQWRPVTFLSFILFLLWKKVIKPRKRKRKRHNHTTTFSFFKVSINSRRQVRPSTFAQSLELLCLVVLGIVQHNGLEVNRRTNPIKSMALGYVAYITRNLSVNQKFTIWVTI